MKRWSWDKPKSLVNLEVALKRQEKAFAGLPKRTIDWSHEIWSRMERLEAANAEGRPPHFFHDLTDS